jgi:hypothetical protein
VLPLLRREGCCWKCRGMADAGGCCFRRGGKEEGLPLLLLLLLILAANNVEDGALSWRQHC